MISDNVNLDIVYDISLFKRSIFVYENGVPICC